MGMSGKRIGQKEITFEGAEADLLVSLKGAHISRESGPLEIHLSAEKRQLELVFETKEKQQAWLRAFRLHGILFTNEAPRKREKPRNREKENDFCFALICSCSCTTCACCSTKESASKHTA